MNRTLKLLALGFPLLYAAPDRLLASGGELQFSSSLFTVSSTAAYAQIGVDLLNSSGGMVVVDFSTSDLMGAAGSSYTPVNGKLTFFVGETEKFFSVPLIYNPDEGPVTVELTLSNPINATIANPSAELLIEPVPEPSAMVLTGLGVAALATVVRRRKG